MNSLFSSVSAQQLRKAAGIKERIEALHSELARILGSNNEAGARALPRKRRKMSRSAIAKISAAAKARWARIKGASGKSGRKPRRKMSAAARARLSALAKARWKKAKAQGKTAL
jgi:hypothetical protein